MADSGYRDFIPAGDETGGAGNGYQDFVPTPQPVKQPEEPAKAQQPKEAPKK